MQGRPDLGSDDLPARVVEVDGELAQEVRSDDAVTLRSWKLDGAGPRAAAIRARSAWTSGTVSARSGGAAFWRPPRLHERTMGTGDSTMNVATVAGVVALFGASCLPLGAQAQSASPSPPAALTPASPAVNAPTHTIATPPEVGAASTAPAFSLEGFTLPNGCLAIADNCAPSVASEPIFEPETDKYRPVINISFVPSSDARCGVGQVETVNGQTKIIPTLAGVVNAKKGERTFVGAVFYDAQERHQAGIDESQAYRFAVMCRSTSGDTQWSTFYEAPQPPQGT